MTKIFNRKADRIKRKYLRNNMTLSEKELWKYIRKRQINGYKFRRQYSVCGFVVDFYCPKLKLAIEVDGNIHLKKENILYDKERQVILESIGIIFLRFKNNDILNNIKNVLNKISKKTKELASQPPTL